jgi:hypothetical protein
MTAIELSSGNAEREKSMRCQVWRGIGEYKLEHNAGEC